MILEEWFGELQKLRQPLKSYHPVVFHMKNHLFSAYGPLESDHLVRSMLRPGNQRKTWQHFGKVGTCDILPTNLQVTVYVLPRTE